MTTESKIPEQTQISFSPAQLNIVQKALEIYARGRMGQFDVMIDEMFLEHLIGWENRQDISRFIRSKLFNRENEHIFSQNVNASHGISNPLVGDGQLAYEIGSVIRQYKAIKRNDGFFSDSYSVDFHDPLKLTGEKLPEIVGFNKYVDFEVEAFTDRTQYESIYNAFLIKDYKSMWEFIDRYMKLPKCERKEVLEACFDKNDFAPFASDSDYRLVVRCHKPIKETNT